MDLESELSRIMNNAYVDILAEGLKKETTIFSQIEEFLSSKGMASLDSEIWYLCTDEEGEELESINEEDRDENSSRIDIKYKATYSNLFKGLHDLDMIQECKDDGGVGIITRSYVALTPHDVPMGTRYEDIDGACGLMTTLTTPLAVHTIVRLDDKISQTTIERQNIKVGDSTLVDALIHACFHW